MALITCKECGSEVSSEAKTCPKCGVRIKPKSKVWMWVLGVPAALFVVFAVIGANDPEIQAMSHDREKIDLCLSQLHDSTVDLSARNLIVRPVCERFKDEFRTKYRREP